MAGQLITPLVAAIDNANLAAAHLAGAVTKLFQPGPQVSPSTSVAELDAVEATYDGYTPGGIVVPGWAAAVFGPGAGAVVIAEPVQFRFASGGPGVKNLIAGFYLVTSGGVLWRVGTFPTPFPMQTPGMGFPINWLFGYAAG